MKRVLRRSALVIGFVGAFGFALAQLPEQQCANCGRPPSSPSPDAQRDIQLPNGKSQRDEILKAEHEQNIKDAARLAELADDLKQTLEKEDRFVFSLNTVKKAEEIEKLARKIRTRIRHD